MDQADSVLVRQQRNLSKEIDAEILSISSNSSICSDFCGFKEFQDIEMSLRQSSKYLKDVREFSVDSMTNIEKKTEQNLNQPEPTVASANEAKKRFFVSEMELLPAEEIFEVNSNSTTDTLRRQRLERNKELRLKETFLISRNPIKKLAKNTFQKIRAGENSESSSEFPASSPSNTQLQKKPQQSQRPPLLKNTLPADAFERGLAFIAAQNPPMTVSDKINAWQCESIDKQSDVEDVISFEESFKSRECSTKRLPTRSKTAVAGEAYTTFSEFYKRISSVRAPDTSLRGSDSKQKSKFTSEDDEKPTTSNCLVRNRDTPLKKRPSKYKRAADPLNEALIPKKKSSSSGTPKRDMPSAKRKPPQHKVPATAAGDDAVKVCAESSAASSLAQTKGNSKSSSARIPRQFRAKQAKIAETGTISSNLRKQIGLTTTPTKEDQDAFFRWRRLSREIDKTSPSRLKTEATDFISLKPSTGLIQIRYDFMGPNELSKQEEEPIKPNAYNVVVKTLKQESQHDDENKDDVVFKTPIEPQKFREIKSNPTTSLMQQQQQEPKCGTKEKAEILVNEIKPLGDSNIKSKGIEEDVIRKTPNGLFDLSVEFHQQHEFCNYLGLTGMSTANAMANAAEELSKCNVARRSLRVRKIEIQKAKASKKTTPKKTETNGINTLLESVRPVTTAVAHQENQSDSFKSETMENSSSAVCTENLETKTLLANDQLITTALTPSEELVQQTKEKEAKIQILCQITASSKKEEDEACKKCVEKITEPIRRTLLEQCKQSGDSPKACNSRDDLDINASKRLLSGISSSLPLSALVPRLQPTVTEAVNQADHKATKFIELTPKVLNKSEKNGKAELQTLHEKVQRCLEESRQNPPNIFIVKSLDSLKDDKITENTEKQAVENICKNENSLLEGEFDVEEDDVLEGTEVPLKRNMRLEKAVRTKKTTQVSAAGAAKNRKRKSRNSNIRKANSNLSGTRRLYTRSMLNLNQQRELRNRKVILKLLKTYSGLRIKVSQPKKKTNVKEIGVANNNVPINKKKIPNNHAVGGEASVELTISSEDTTVGDKKSAPVTTLFVNKLSDSNSTNDVRESSSNEELASANENTIVDTTNDLSKKQSKSFETKTLFECKNLFARESENINIAAAASSSTLTPKLISSPKTVVLLNPIEKLADAAVQTDLANVTTILQPICLDGTADDSLVAPTQQCTQTRDNNDTDVVSSSDVVTSTTTHIGENSRPGANHPSKQSLVTKELYRNFSFTAESNVAADAASSQSSTTSHLFTEINPLVNISPNSSSANINDLGIHVLSEPSRALRNPLKSSAGSVLYIYYEDGLLIVVQEALVSFWKYSRVLNALNVKLHDAKFSKSCNSGDLGSEELQSSAATMDFRSSDLEPLSQMLVSGCEWFYLGEKKRLTSDIEIDSPYTSRLCFNDSRPVYVEMRCKELLNDFRECNLLSCYVNVYFFNEEEQVPCFHSIQLDSIQSAAADVIYTTIFDSRYFVLAWPQANVLGKVRSGVCKYALTPELDMLATTRDFKTMRHALRSLECLKDGKLLGFGDSQLTVWDHRSGDVLMNYDLSMPLGHNLGTIYYQGLEDGQDNVVIMLQHVRSEVSSELVVIACTISPTNPSRRVLQRHRLPTPAFYNICRGINNGEHFVITAVTDEEIWINCNDPRQLIFIPSQRTQRFYSTNRTMLVELTQQTLTVDTFSNYLLKIAAGISNFNKKLTVKVPPSVDNKAIWTY